MRFRLSLCRVLFPIGIAAMVYAATARSEDSKSEEVKFDSNSPLTEFFKSPDEVVEVYRQRLKAAAESKKISAFGAVFGAKEDSTALAEQDKRFAGYFEEAGPIVRVDAQNLPQLGDTIRRVGYIVFFEHNLMFCDVWFYHTAKGWAPLKTDFKAAASEEVLESIPDVFFN